MGKRTFLVVLLTFLFSSSASALTVDDVIYLSSAGVEDSIILAKIDASGVVFDLSTQEIVELWNADVSPDVIEYMISTAAGIPEARDDVGAEYDYDDDDVIIVQHPGTRVHLYFGFGYYDDSWYYPYWSWYRPYYYDAYYSYGYHWPYYYHWNPYAYYYPWDCWAYGHGGHIVAGRGMRHQWRRTEHDGARYAGRSGYRLKPSYSYTDKDRGKGGYLASDGRYVFPKDKSRDGYLGTHRGYRKPLAADGGGGRDYRGRTYDKNRSYTDRRGRSGYSKSTRVKSQRGKITRSGTTKDKRYQGTRTRSSTPSGKSKAATVKSSRGGGSSKSRRSSVHSSRPRSGGTRSSVRGSRSSGSRGSAQGSSRSSGSSRGSRGGRKR